MYNLPLVNSPENLESLLKTIEDKEVPDKFTYRHLSKLGFASSNDRDLLPALKLLGFLDSKGRPTQAYVDLKDPRYKNETLKKGLKLAYKELFILDPDAETVSENVLNRYFSKLTGKSIEECSSYTATFKKLLSLTDLQKEQRQTTQNETIEINTQGQPQSINININIPVTTNKEVYKALFSHLKALLKP